MTEQATQAEREIIAAVCRACGYDGDAEALVAGTADAGWQDEITMLRVYRDEVQS